MAEPEQECKMPPTKCSICNNVIQIDELVKAIGGESYPKHVIPDIRKGPYVIYARCYLVCSKECDEKTVDRLHEDYKKEKGDVTA